MPSCPVEEMKIEEVACAIPASEPTTKYPLVTGRVTTAPLPPRMAGLLEIERKPVAVKVEVAAPATPAPPVEYKRLLVDGCDVVARPVYVIVESVPPTSAPETLPMKGPEKARVVVDTEASAEVPLPYKSCDAVKVVTPVPPWETAAVPTKLANATFRDDVATQDGRPVVYELVRKPPVEVASVVRAAVPPPP